VTVAAKRGAIEDLATERVAGAGALVALLDTGGIALGQDGLVGFELALVEISAVDDGAGTVDGEDLGVVGEANDTLGVFLQLASDIVKGDLCFWSWLVSLFLGMAVEYESSVATRTSPRGPGVAMAPPTTEAIARALRIENCMLMSLGKCFVVMIALSDVVESEEENSNMLMRNKASLYIFLSISSWA
jgi:hypothetical protein